MEVLFYIGIAGFILFGPWVLVWWTNSRRKHERREDQLRWADLAGRVSQLERDLRHLRENAAAPTPLQQPAPKPQAADAVSAPEPAPRIQVPPTPAQTTAEAWVTRRAEPPPAKPSLQSVPTPPPQTPPSFSSPHIEPSLFDRFKSSLDIEEMLGTDWLNKLGIILLVLGVAFFLAYQLRTMGPAGKVLVGLVTGGVLLGAGIWIERRDRYRILARAGIGGGWALLFFTTYAMYHVPAAQVLQSQVTDLLLMLVVAAAMVAHTLRYRSQVVTGLAFLLAFLTVTISHSNVYSLTAGAVLAAALVFIVWRMQWFELEVFGILASYLNHYLWLRPIIEPMHGKHHPFPEFAASAGILVLYWLIYRLSYVFRSPRAAGQERISTAAALLNTSLLLVLLKYQSAHPEWAFWALLGIGALETIFGQISASRHRRTPVIVLSTLGVVLLIAAFPFRYSGARLSVLWLADAEALLLIGVWTKEVIFRRLGMIASVLVAGQMISYDAAAIFGRRMDDADLRPNFALAVLFVVAAAIFYANAHWVLRNWSSLFSTEFDQRVMQRLSYAGMVMMLFAAWIAFPQSWCAVFWSALAFTLAIAAQRLDAPSLRYQATFVAALSLLRALSINLEETGQFHGITLRLITISAVSALLYATSRWSPTESATSFDRIASESYTWAGSLLLTLLAWYELRPVGVADAWVVGALVLLELGVRRKSLGLRLQAYAALSASFLRIFFVNLNADGLPGQITPRFYSVVPIALALYYVYWHLQSADAELSRIDRKFKAAQVSCWLGTITAGALIRFELEPDWVAAAWAALAFALLAIAWRGGRSIFLRQSLLVVFGVLFRTVLHNFYERSYFPAPFWESRWITAGAAIALLVAALPLAFQLRSEDEPTADNGLVRMLQAVGSRPEQLVFFVALGLLTVLLGLEMRHGMVTLSWGIEGLAVFLLALRAGERSFRLSGLGLLLLCVGKILVDDVWRLNPRDRYLTFIVLGAALLLVSFLYTRNREALRRYL